MAKKKKTKSTAMSEQVPQILALKRPTKPSAEKPVVDETSLPITQPKEPNLEKEQATIEQPKKPEIPNLDLGSEQQPGKSDRDWKQKPVSHDIESATKANGEVFRFGDTIQVIAPWGEYANAEIVGFHLPQSGEIYAEFKPLASRDAWQWERGIKLLVSR